MGIENILLAGGSVVLVTSATPALLGFGTIGVSAGSTAAAIQSGIGCVSSGSAFSVMTSLGMKGVFAKGVFIGTGSTLTGGIFLI